MPEHRDQVVDFVAHWHKRTLLTISFFLCAIGIHASRFYDWKRRYKRKNRHNAPVPRQHWLEDWERAAIIEFFEDHPDLGYRRLTYMMLDEDIVAVSPSTTYNVLKSSGLLEPRFLPKSSKGQGFQQPTAPHEHWHIDVAYINVAGTFFYLCSILDGFARAIIHWELRECMKEQDVEVILQRGLESVPGAKPRIISDNGPQFVAGQFKALIRIHGLTHVRTAPYYPQSNGKIERWHRSLKSECIRPKTPVSLEDARRVVARYVTEYNTERLHSAIGYITPADMLAGNGPAIFAERTRKLEEARERRRLRRADLSASEDSVESETENWTTDPTITHDGPLTAVEFVS